MAKWRHKYIVSIIRMWIAKKEKNKANLVFIVQLRYLFIVYFRVERVYVGGKTETRTCYYVIVIWVTKKKENQVNSVFSNQTLPIDHFHLQYIKFVF